MAQFCTKCGAPLGEGMKFCTSCGATMGGPPAPPAQTPAAQPPAAAVPSPTPGAPSLAPAAPAAAAPAAKPGSPVLKIILIVLLVLILLGILAAGSCVYFLYRAKQNLTQLGKEVHTTLPAQMGTREVHPQPAAPAAVPTPPAGPVVDTGVAIYPGATPWGGGNQMTMGGTNMKSQEYTTDDSVDKVLAFYKDKMGANAMVTQSGGSAALQVLTANPQITISIKPDAGTGKTKITISSVAR